MKKTGIVLVIVLLLAAGFFQWGIDRRSSETDQRNNGAFNNAYQLLDFLGGVRQYLAYSLFVKNDKLHHTYYGAPTIEGPLIPYFYLIGLLDPHYTDAYYIGAGIIADQGKIDQAIDFVSRGIDANPDSADLYFELADLYLVQKQYDKAVSYLKEALQGKPQSASRFSILRALAASYMGLKAYSEARQIYIDMALDYGLLKYSSDLDLASIKDVISVINNAIESQGQLPVVDQAQE